MGKEELKKRKRKFRESRHIRWNYETSEDNFYENSRMLRYHFVIVDDKNRESRLCWLLEKLPKISSFTEIRRRSGKVVGTKFRYLFASYDSPANPNVLLNLEKTNPLLKRDKNLIERKKGNIEDYVDRIYS